MLATIGDLVEDVVVWLDGPIVRGADAPARVLRRQGGSAANVAGYAASHGFAARFIGQIGDDSIGAILIEALERDGVDVRVTRRGRTGSIVVLVDADGERSFLSDRGASVDLARVDDGALVGVDVLHVPSYSLTVEPLGAASIDAIERARRSGARISIGTSSVTVIADLGVGAYRALLRSLAPDVVIANADEAALAELVTAPFPTTLTIVTDGASPTRAGELMVEVAPIGVVRDTTGAGDAFAAGFLSTWGTGMTLVDAVRAGHALSADVLSRHLRPDQPDEVLEQ